MKTNISLLPYHTFGAKVTADYFTTFSTVDELTSIVNQKKERLPFLILGGGSNVLFTKNYHGLIIKNEIKGFEVIHENEKEVTLKIGAGENWHETVLKTTEKGWQGIENLALIPGTMGASPIQNIGAYGVEVKDVIESVTFYHLEEKCIKTYQNAECHFGYRNSIFKKELKGKIVVTSVTIKLNKKFDFNTSYGVIEEEIKRQNITRLTPAMLAQIIIKIRESKLPNPSEIGNCGSFFKNPVLLKEDAQKVIDNYPNAPHYIVNDNKIKIPAGWLIQTAGWKGKSLGNVGTYPKQALVLVNNGGATGEEAWNLALQIQKDVKDQFGITIEPEVNIV